MYKRILQYVFSTSLCIVLLWGGCLAINVVEASTMTLYQCYKEKGIKWTGVRERAISGIPAEYGIWNYTGTAEQNTKLAKKMCGNYDSENPQLGFSVVTNYRSTLSLPMESSQSTVPVSSLLTKDNHTLTMADLGDFVYLTIEPGGVKEEIVKCTGISASSFTGCTRGLAFYGTSTVSVASNKKTHNAGSVVVMSNVHYVYEEKLSAKDNILSFGDASSSTDKYIYFNDGTSNPAAIKWDATENQLKFRRANGDAYRTMPTQLRGIYTNYASLPASGNSKGDLAVTEDDDKIYVWDDVGSTWVLAGGSSGAGTMYKTEKLGSESDGGDLKTFTLTAGSWPSTKFLMVYKNGQLQRIGASYDYVEVDSNTIEFNYELYSDDLVSMIVVSVDLYNPAWGVVNDSIIPDTDNAYDIGTSSKKFRELHLGGSAAIDVDTWIGGNLTVEGKTTIGGWTVFGGSGIDGDLSISSGTTTIDLGGVTYFEKNYSSISITGTGSLAFSNPNTNGTVIVLKSSGNVIITSSASPAINISSLGGDKSNGTNNSNAATASYGVGLFSSNNGGGGGQRSPIAGGGGGVGSRMANHTFVKGITLACGGGGGGGMGQNAAGGNGGRGAGALYIEVGGDLNFTGLIKATGDNGANGVNQGSYSYAGGGGGGGILTDGSSGSSGDNSTSGGGGGGGGGSVVILYKTASATSGTITVTGGSGGSVGGGNGGTGWSLLAENK